MKHRTVRKPQKPRGPHKIGGLPVKDADKPVIITITNRDIKNGAIKAPSSCAAALACHRISKVEDARIHIGRSYLKIGGKWIRYVTSKPLRTEIIAFDRGGEFAPGEYTLQAVPTGQRYEAMRNHGAKRSPHKAKKRIIAIRHQVTGVRPRGANR